MHQVGWMRRRLFPAVAIPAVPPLKFTRPRCLRVHWLTVPLVRDSSSLLRRLSPRVPTPRRPQKLQNTSRLPDSTPSKDNRGSPPLPRLKNRVQDVPTVKRATSRISLYKNLLFLSSPPPASLPILLDYHRIHDGFRSAQSYNLLISLAIRHTAYGTVQFLFNAMSTDQIRGNLATQKLKTRWFVRTGYWEHAWHQVTTTHAKPIPLVLWLELLQGVTSVRPSHHRMAPRTTRVKSPQRRFQLLMRNIPPFLPDEDQRSARAVRVLARAMLALNRPQAALSLTARYLNGIPRDIGVQWAKQCVAIIDSIVAFECRKRGLVDFHSARRKLNSLLAIHPMFHPTPRTLYLLLGTLRQAKRRGTVAWQTLNTFKTRWGPEVEDRRVRRRVASYAIQERRLEIIDKVFDAERRSRALVREARTSEERRLVPSGQMPFRGMYPQHGYEQRLWKWLSIRALKVKLQLKEKTAIKLSDPST
ncbi:hypothetical protein C8F04DRAFT_1232158 [Mycena alexandri]|uniref:Uncharacterized protein n=1 Tax=Mycena alexandri TaxID=1745969 RepID=A0AAD6T1W1_9AGAR|nr:hypothetical protein C8F04DRAFT_1232158 [Mycena alexandri]